MTLLTEEGDWPDREDPEGISGRHVISFPRLELVLSALIIVGICTIVFIASIKPQLDHQHWFVRVQGSIKKLAPMRPPGVSHEQWANAVAWTLNAHVNCCSSPEFLTSRDKAELQRFGEKLDRRLRPGCQTLFQAFFLPRIS